MENKNMTVSPEAIKWLKAEYPRGIELVYVDYRDSYDDNISGLVHLLKNGYSDDEDWIGDAQWDTINGVIVQYEKEKDIELDDDEREEMKDWLYEHDASDTQIDLLRHTRKQLCYIETTDYISTDGYVNGNGNYCTDEEAREMQYQALCEKYATTDEQRAEIKSQLREQFYGAPLSFYFYADMTQLYKTIMLDAHQSYITIEGAYFSTIDRVQGSNWLGDKAIFTITVPRDEFIENFHLDKEDGTGYGWDSIAGQVDYDEASVYTNDKLKGVLVTATESIEAKREQELAEHWKKTKTCVRGDMNWNRHKGEKTYSNNYPCGSTCSTCGTFWID